MNNQGFIPVTAAVITRDGKVLISRRARGPLAGFFEFPGGKLEPGEIPREGLKREIKEELGIEIEVGDFIYKSRYAYEHVKVELLAYFASYKDGILEPREHSEIRFTEIADIDEDLLAPADIPILRELKERLK